MPDVAADMSPDKSSFEVHTGFKILESLYIRYFRVNRSSLLILLLLVLLFQTDNCFEVSFESL